MCDHQYSYAGVRYFDGACSMPGTGARQRYYAHVYFCTRCTDTKGEKIEDTSGGRPNWNTYQKLQFNATPGTDGQCGVPLEDQR